MCLPLEEQAGNMMTVEQMQDVGLLPRDVRPDEGLELAELRDTIESALTVLRPSPLLVVRGFYLKGLTCQELASQLNVSVPHVRRIMAAALRKLRSPRTALLLLPYLVGAPSSLRPQRDEARRVRDEGWRRTYTPEQIGERGERDVNVFGRCRETSILVSPF